MNHENKPPNEDLYRDKLIDLLQAKMKRETPDFMERDAHPKQHGLVKATFTVAEDLPANLQHGVFVPGKSYPAWVRFSNQNAPRQADTKKDIRGAAIKLMNVPGTKLETHDGNTTSQDFITISTPVFVTHDVEEFFHLIEALVKGKLALLWHFLFHPRSLLNLLRSNKNYASPLQTRYWSTTPYKLGPQQVVKYSLIPQAGVVDRIPSNAGPDFLRENMVKQLAEHDYGFDFCVQLQTDADLMPVEDPGTNWPETVSPFVKVATLTIPSQPFDTPAQNAYGIDMSFNPWHSLLAHQPLGGINRARRVVYNELSNFRHTHNGQLRREPTDYDVPELAQMEPAASALRGKREK